MLAGAVRQRFIVEQLADLVDHQHAAVAQLLGHLDLAACGHVLQPVRREGDPVPAVQLALGECHPAHGLRHLDGKRFNRAIEKGVQVIPRRPILQHGLADPEIIHHVVADQLHLVRIDLVPLLLDLLDVRKLIPEQQQTAGALLEVVPVEALALFPEILVEGLPDQLRHEAEGRAVLHALLDALVDHVHQLHGGLQRAVLLAEEVVRQLMLHHQPDAVQRDAAALSADELELQPWIPAALDHLAGARQRGEESADFAVLIQQRDNEQIVLHLKDV